MNRIEQVRKIITNKDNYESVGSSSDGYPTYIIRDDLVAQEIDKLYSTIPKAGSEEAKKLGCTCPKGRIFPNCPIHDTRLVPDSTTLDDLIKSIASIIRCEQKEAPIYQADPDDLARIIANKFQPIIGENKRLKEQLELTDKALSKMVLKHGLNDL